MLLNSSGTKRTLMHLFLLTNSAQRIYDINFTINNIKKQIGKKHYKPVFMS